MQRFSHWRDRAEMLVPPLPWDQPRWRDAGGPVVVLLHGLWRGCHAMEPLARELNRNGFSTLNIPYPSHRLPVEVLTRRIREAIAKVAGDEPVHFITHSLGGILLRAMVAEGVPWRTGRVVMLAPPNRGSEIVDWAHSHPPLHRVLGPAGGALGCAGLPKQLPALPPEIPTAVIMGNRSSIPVFKKLLGLENDGIVSTENGRLDGLCGFSVIAADHTFIQLHPETLRLTLAFFNTGVWLGNEAESA